MELHFKEITAESLGEMMPYYSMRHNRTCDSVFLESFIWKEFYNVRYAIWEEKALLWVMEDGGEYFSAMPLCREEDLPAAFHAIETYFNEVLKSPLVIHLADEYAVQYLKLPEEQYLVEEQPDARDYLYEGNALRNLPGKKLHKKKNRVNAFKRAYEGRYEFRRLCCSDSFEVWKFLDMWRETKGEDVEEHLDYEVRGIHDILKNCSDLYVRMGGVYVDGRLEAFSIGSYNPVENMAVIHIEKANPEINGLYQYINQQFLIEEFPEVDWVNREDDLGIEGLRQAKMSYMPADFANKYLVRQRDKREETEISYLKDSEKQETIPLWEQCFSEDSQSFIDYYYKEKTADNRILTLKTSGGSEPESEQGNKPVVSMLHRNPYRILIQGKEQKLDYVVAVATEPSHRKKGYMRQLFQRLLNDQAAEEKAMTYLVPATPTAAQVYAGLDFAFIGNLAQYELKPEAEAEGAGQAGCLQRRRCQDTPEDISLAASYMEHWLSSRYEVHTRRDAAYVSRLLKELASEDGYLDFLFRENGELAGVQAFWGLEKKEQRLLYAEEEYTIKTGEKPWNMARIVDLFQLLSLFELKAEVKEVYEQEEDGWYLLLDLKDPILEENSGRFVWSMADEAMEEMLLDDHDHDRDEPDDDFDEEEGTEVPCLSCTPAELIAFLFGYRSAEELWPEAGAEVTALLHQVDVVQGVCLDEIV